MDNQGPRDGLESLIDLRIEYMPIYTLLVPYIPNPYVLRATINGLNADANAQNRECIPRTPLV